MKKQFILNSKQTSIMIKNLFILLLIWGIISAFKTDAIIYSVPEEFTPDFVDYQLDPSIHTQLHIGNEGTLLHIPENAFVDMEGNIVEEPVTIQFKEYRNSADMAFSKIPMTYKGNNFNSSGMFEIQGQCKGEPVRVANGKSLKIDYHVARKNPNTDFYRLNESTKQWVLVSDIPQMSDPTASNGATYISPASPPQEEIVDEREGVLEVRDEVLRNNNYDNNINVRNPIQVRGPRVFTDAIDEEEYEEQVADIAFAFGNGPAGSFPDVVTGLSISGFGVYNCDQVYRVENRVQITASYQDSEGNPINDLHSLSLIDLNLNGAFSYNPKRFLCNSKGNNVLVMLNEAGQLFLLEKGEFSKMKIKEDGAYTFTLKNVSSQIKNTEDLAKYLGIS